MMSCCATPTRAHACCAWQLLLFEVESLDFSDVFRELNSDLTSFYTLFRKADSPLLVIVRRHESTSSTTLLTLLALRGSQV